MAMKAKEAKKVPTKRPTVEAVPVEPIEVKEVKQHEVKLSADIETADDLRAYCDYDATELFVRTALSPSTKFKFPSVMGTILKTAYDLYSPTASLTKTYSFALGHSLNHDVLVEHPSEYIVSIIGHINDRILNAEGSLNADVKDRYCQTTLSPDFSDDIDSVHHAAFDQLQEIVNLLHGSIYDPNFKELDVRFILNAVAPIVNCFRSILEYSDPELTNPNFFMTPPCSEVIGQETRLPQHVNVTDTIYNLCNTIRRSHYAVVVLHLNVFGEFYPEADQSYFEQYANKLCEVSAETLGKVLPIHTMLNLLLDDLKDFLDALNKLKLDASELPSLY